MSLPGVCPDCGAKFPLPLALNDARARQALLSALQIAPSLADRIIGYLGLFTPGKRAISMDKLASILEELSEMISTAEITRKGVTWPAPIEYWREALDQVNNNRSTLLLPLKGHGYLLEIIAGIASKNQGKAEQKREQQLRTGQKTQPKPSPDEPSGQELFDRHMKEIGFRPGGDNGKT